MSMFVSMYFCVIFVFLSEHFRTALSSERVRVTKGRQKAAKESLIPQGLNNLFDVAFLTLRGV